MKKLLLFVFAALALSLVACEQLEDIFNSDDDKIELLYGEQLSFISDQGDTKSYTFSTTLDWIANDSESWIEVSPTSGYAGESIIDITIDKNNSDERRTGHVDITMTNGMSYRINIEQYAADEEVISGTVPSKEIWYTSTDGNVVTPNRTDVFGANIISNTYNNGKGVITFDGDVTSIGFFAFHCSGLTSITIPDSVTSIGDSAFRDCDNLTSVNIPDSVTTIGNYAFAGCDSLTSVTIGDSVTSIGNYAFDNCTNLTSVTIGDSVTTIGDRAFYYCSSLTSVNIPDSVTTIGSGAFSDCTSLKEFKGKFAEDNGRILVVDGVLAAFAPTGITEYTIPDSVTTIGGGAFWECTNLTSVTIGDSITTIGDEAFYHCTSLTSVYCKATTPPALGGTNVFDYNGSDRKIYVPAGSVEAYKSAGYWSEYASAIVGYDFENGEIVEVQPNNEIWYTSSDGNVVTPNRTDVFGANIKSNTYNNGKGVITFGGDVTTIGYETFYNCDRLTSIIIPNSVTSIGNEAFEDCTSLTSVNIPDSVTTIRSSAFAGCDSLTSVTIPDSVTTIGDSAFTYCDSLTSVTIGDGVTTIGYSAFSYCGSLTSITIPDSVTTIGNCAFWDCDSLTSVTIGDSVTTIGSNTFYSCCSLTSVNIPDSVTTIGWYAFSYCTSLTSVNIPDSVTTIGEGAFYYCTSLTSVTIPDSVTIIRNYAFEDCTSLTSVYCKATTPPALGWDVFAYNGSDRKIYVPAGSVDAYKSAGNWSKYADDITGYDF